MQVNSELKFPYRDTPTKIRYIYIHIQSNMRNELSSMQMSQKSVDNCTFHTVSVNFKRRQQQNTISENKLAINVAVGCLRIEATARQNQFILYRKNTSIKLNVPQAWVLQLFGWQSEDRTIARSQHMYSSSLHVCKRWIHISQAYPFIYFSQCTCN